jgi:PAS domain S-box-containing protein
MIMKLPIRWKILLFVIVPILVIYTSIMAFNILTMRQWALVNVEQRMTELTNSYAHRFDSQLRETAQAAIMTAAYVEKNPGLSSDQIYALLQANLERNPLVYGSAVAFEPYKYDPNRRLFVRYVYRDGKTFQRADPSETGYDYTELKQKYWHIPRDTGRGVWTDPYFDEGAGNILMSTYSVPFFSNKTFLGIATVDIPLEPLRELSQIGIPGTIKINILTKSGKFVYSPHLERINQSISKIWQGQDSKGSLEIALKIVSGETGSAKSANWESKKLEWIFYSPIRSSMWGFAASIPASMVLQPVQKQFYRNVAFFVISLVLILACLWFVSRKISRPIMRLNKTVEEISKGDLSIKATVESDDELGALARAFNEMTDKISERERRILDSEKRLNTLLSNLPQKIFHKDKNSVYLDCNENFASDLKISSNQIAGKTDYDFFPAELADQYIRDDKRIIESGQIETIEEEYIISDGQIRTVQTVKTPIWNNQGEIVGLLGIFMDISARKKAKEELLKWGHIFETARWGIALSGVGGNKFELMNPAYAEMHGYNVAELLEKEISVVFIPSFREEIPGVIQKCDDLGHLTFEADHMRQDGSTFPAYHDVTTVKDEKGQVLYRILSVLDITDRKKAEEEKANLESQLRQAHKMEAIGTMAGGIAHDFNNILAAILGYADMAKDDTPDYSPAKYQIEQVLKAGNRAKELVKHILSFSRKEAMARSPVQIHLLVKEALKLLRASIPTTVEIKQNIDSQCGNILADPTQIHQVLMNLCTNAAQAMDENGGVLEVGLISHQLGADDLMGEQNLKPGHYVRLSVTDSGIGVDQKYLDRIFDPYFTTKEVGKGSGMGLAVVIGIVKSHDGMITVDSKPGKGTTFHIYFPRIDAQIQENIEKAAPLPTGQERILVIDDEESIVDVTKQQAERLGYQVTAKTSSMEALELFRSQPDAFDLIITDQTMPELTGEKLAEKLMEIRPDIPVIICTGYSNKIDAEKANLIGISAFIMKPIDKTELAKTIRQVLDTDISNT